MIESKLGNGMSDAAGLEGVQGGGFARGDIAKGTAARADLAHDHHGGVTLAPAFTNIGTTRLFADRHQLFVAQDIAGFAVTF